MPKALADEPQLDTTAEELAKAYGILSTKRTIGFAPNPIQLSEIKAFIELYGEPSVGYTIFEEIIRVMDGADLEFMAAKTKVSEGNGSS